MSILVLTAIPAQLVHVCWVHWPCNAHLPLKHIYGCVSYKEQEEKRKAYFSLRYGSICLQVSEICCRLFCKYISAMAWSFNTSNWCYASFICLLSSQAMCQIPFLMYICIVFYVMTPLTVFSGTNILKENTVFISSQSVISEDMESSFIALSVLTSQTAGYTVSWSSRPVTIWTYTTIKTWPQT